MHLTIPEPELLICVNTPGSILSFPPWLIRLTEITYAHNLVDLLTKYNYDLSSVHSSTLINLLTAFSQTEQRCGT